MTSPDLTVRILEEIRDDIRGMRQDQREMREAQDGFARSTAERFEVVETTLRDLAQQLIMLGRALKVAIDDRSQGRDRLDEHERRIAALEKKQPRPTSPRRRSKT